MLAGRATEVPRAQGMVRLSTKARDGSSVLDDLRMAGCMKALFPRGRAMQTILVNSSGGLTSGDRLSVEARAGAGTHLTLTTQAAERAYRADLAPARVTTRLSVEAGARLDWLPQELILFDRAALSRRLDIDLAADARLLMVEPVVFGRAAMGETVRSLRFSDRVRVTRAGRPLWIDGAEIDGDATAMLARPAVADGARAMASVLYVAPDAEAHLAPLRAMLGETAGASLAGPDTLALRLLAEDGYTLRTTLLPVLDRLSGTGLPTSWRL